MSNERYAKGPLLYIHQPKAEKINVEMQSHYRSSKMKDREGLEVTAGKEEDKKFPDMTVAEQLNYLIQKPEYAPQVNCQFKTEDGIYQGVVTDRTENTVTIQSGRRKMEIQIEKINQIRILGL